MTPPKTANSADFFSNLGFALFPLYHNANGLRKAPAVAEWSDERKWPADAALAAYNQAIRGWDSAKPPLGIGGRIPEGLLVLDIDAGHVPAEVPATARDAWLQAARSAAERLSAELPATLRTSTPSGGFHVFLRCPADGLPAKAELPLPGFDAGLSVELRRRGQFLVLPPTTNGAGRYQTNGKREIAAMPADALRAALAKFGARLDVAPALAPAAALGPYGVANLQNAAEAESFRRAAEEVFARIEKAGVTVLGKRPGARELLIDVACPNSGEHTTPPAERESAFMLGFDRKGAIFRGYKCQHSHCDGLTYARAFQLAEAQRENPGVTLAVAVEKGLLRKATDSYRTKNNGGEISAGVGRRVFFPEIKASKTEWLVEGHLIKGKPNLVFGVEGHGKTFYLVWLAKQIWERGGRVYFICEHTDDLKTRLECAGVDTASLRLATYKIEFPPATAGGEPRRVDAPLNHTGLLADLADFRPDLVIVDPIWRFYGKDVGERGVWSAEDFVALTGAFAATCDSVGATIEYCNHISKAPKAFSTHSSYGSGGLTRDVRFAIRWGKFQESEGGPWRYVAIADKNNNTKDRPPQEFEILGPDGAGYMVLKGDAPDIHRADICSTNSATQRGERGEKLQGRIAAALAAAEHPLSRNALAKTVGVTATSGAFKRALTELKKDGCIKTKKYGKNDEQKIFFADPEVTFPATAEEARRAPWWDENDAENSVNAPYTCRGAFTENLDPSRGQLPEVKSVNALQKELGASTELGSVNAPAVLEGKSDLEKTENSAPSAASETGEPDDIVWD